MHQLDDIIQRLNEINVGSHHKNSPPVESWQPKHQGSIDIHINSQGVWFHEGAEFKRQSLVKLFSSILRFEAGIYSLVTPAEQLSIRVDDVPFIAELLVESNTGWQLLTQCDDVVPLNQSTCWELREFEGEQVPYVLVRHSLWARVARHVFYRLVDLSLEQQGEDNAVQSGELVFTSAGASFSLGFC